MLGEGPTYAIDAIALVHQRKSLVMILIKQTQNFVFVCIIMLIILICLLIEKKSLSLKSTIKNINFQIQFRPRSISNGFSATESREVSLRGNVHDFPVDYSSTDKSDITFTSI